MVSKGSSHTKTDNKYRCFRRPVSRIQVQQTHQYITNYWPSSAATLLSSISRECREIKAGNKAICCRSVKNKTAL